MLRSVLQPCQIITRRLQEHRKGQPAASSSLRQRLQGRILPHQLEGIQFGREARGRLLLADDMGLGKTLQAIMIAATFPKDFPALVVAPASVLFNWMKEIRRWLPDRSTTLLRDTRGPLQRTHGFVVVSYNILRLRRKQLAGYGFGIVICDESHYIKNPNTQRTRAATEVLFQAHRRILLSGTPAPKHAVDVFTQLHALLPQRFSNYNDFGSRYSESATLNNFRGSNSEFAELFLTLQESCVLRRTSDVVLSLPPMRREKVSRACPHVEETESLVFWGEWRRQYAGMLAGLVQRIGKLGKPRRRGSGVYTGNKAELTNRVEFLQKRMRLLLLLEWHISGRLKVPSILESVHNKLLQPTSQVLVFAHHADVLDKLSEGLACVSHVRLDGRIPVERRERLIEQFQSGDIRVALLSMTAMSQGVNLTAATHAVLAEIPWTPALFQQALGRMHRIGQLRETSLTVVSLSQPALDEHMICRLEMAAGALSDAGILEPLHWDIDDSPVESTAAEDLAGFRVFVREYLARRLKQRRQQVSYREPELAMKALAQQREQEEGQKCIGWTEKEQCFFRNLRAQWSSMNAETKAPYYPKQEKNDTEANDEVTIADAGSLALALGPSSRNFSTIPWLLGRGLPQLQDRPVVQSKVLSCKLADPGIRPPTMFLPQDFAAEFPATQLRR